MAAGTPRFGPKLDPDEHESHMKNFEAETYRFVDDSRERDRYVNVLHLGIDLDAARHETDSIVEFMRRRGYEAKCMTGRSLSDDKEMFLAGRGADMFILGSDAARHESAFYMLECVGTGWFGIVPYWDMMWYGTDYNPEPPAEWFKQHQMGPSALPLFSGHKFASDAICLAHSHTRRRSSRSALSGEYIGIMRDIEGRINELIKGAWTIPKTQERVKRFKEKVKDDGHDGADVDLFFAALDVLMNSRNTGAHLIRGIPQKMVDKKVEQHHKLMADFDRLAVDCGRMFPPPIARSKADGHLISKWEYGLACMVATWLAEYPASSAA